MLSAALLLCSCGTVAPKEEQVTEATEPPKAENILEVEKLIDAIDIDELTAESEPLIVSAEDAYSELTYEDKKQVENYDKLKEARELFDTTVFTLDELFAVEYISQFSEMYKNPHSIEVYNVWVYTDDDNLHYVAYTFSAKNDLGGSSEDTAGNSKTAGGGLSFKTESEMKTAVEKAYKSAKGSSASFLKYWLRESEADWAVSLGAITAISNGTELDAEKINQAFKDNI